MRQDSARLTTSTGMLAYPSSMQPLLRFGHHASCTVLVSDQLCSLRQTEYTQDRSRQSTIYSSCASVTCSPLHRCCMPTSEDKAARTVLHADQALSHVALVAHSLKPTRSSPSSASSPSLGGSPPLSIGACVLGDMSAPERHGQTFAVYSVAPPLACAQPHMQCVGSGAGGVAMVLLEQEHRGWSD